MIEDAEKNGIIIPGKSGENSDWVHEYYHLFLLSLLLLSVLVEPTSGNTGIIVLTNTYGDHNSQVSVSLFLPLPRVTNV